MKTQKTFSIKKQNFILLGVLFALFISTSSLKAQEITVKGIIKGQTAIDTSVLSGANIYLKDKKIATTSNKKGEFTFPENLKVGDVLIFSYLGFIKKQVKINEKSTFLNIVLLEDNNEMLGALNSNQRFKSKKKKQ